MVKGKAKAKTHGAFIMTTHATSSAVDTTANLFVNLFDKKGNDAVGIKIDIDNSSSKDEPDIFLKLSVERKEEKTLRPRALNFFNGTNKYEMADFLENAKSFVSEKRLRSQEDVIEELLSMGTPVENLGIKIENVTKITSSKEDKDAEDMLSELSGVQVALLIEYSIVIPFVTPSENDTLFPVVLGSPKQRQEQQDLIDKVIKNLNSGINQMVSIVAVERKKGFSYGVKLVGNSTSDLSGFIGAIDDKDEKHIVLKYFSEKGILGSQFFLHQDTDSSVSIIVPEAIMPNLKIPSEFEKVCNRILKEGIDTKTNLIEKINFMRENDFPSELIEMIFNSYKSFEETVEKNYMKPLKISEEEAVYEKKLLVNDLKRRVLQKPKKQYILSDVSYLNASGATQVNLHRLIATKFALGIHTKLEGPKGGGKNTLLNWQAWLFQRPMFEVPLSADTDKDALIGGDELRPTVTGEGTKDVISSFSAESLVKAMLYGGIIIFDEINSAAPSVLTLLHSALDDRKSIDVQEIGKVIADSNFVAAATMNLDYEGTAETNDATIDRFSQIDLPLSNNIKKVLSAHVPQAKEEDLDFAEKIYEELSKGVASGRTDYGDEVETVRGYIVALQQAQLGLSFRSLLCSELIGRCKSSQAKQSIIVAVEKYI